MKPDATANPSRRHFLRSTALASAGLAARCGQSGGEEGSQTPGKRLNIVLIMSDDLGYECLGCYGGTSYRTPRLDALAASGMRFNHAYAQPLCTPTRVQLMTGAYNFRNWQAFGIMPPEEKTIGHMMSAAGYKTCISGKWQLYSYNPPDFEPEWRGKGMHPDNAGFDEYFLWHSEHTEDKGSRYADPVVLDNGTLRTFAGKYGPDVYTDSINNFIERNAGGDDPFFVYYPMALPHGPFNPTPHSDVWAEGDRLSRDRRHYADMVEYMDHVIGRIVDKIDELGIAENTLILYYSDNGTPREVESSMGDKVIKGGKGHTTDAGTHVPMIASWKGVIPEGRVNDDLIDSTDFIPTIMDVTGAEALPEMTLDGSSFLPQLRGETGDPREWVMFHFDPLPGTGKVGYKAVRFARDKRYKLYEETGNLFDVHGDGLEEHPISSDQDTPESAAARRKLKAALDQMKA
jgi:arylsulfatase A-like enzyme